ncbi:MAG TPA: SDR family oxidoreductase [Actinobacteria bacterium]|nr:SDR family oxidoreductase [Actinomycetota bacterium]
MKNVLITGVSKGLGIKIAKKCLAKDYTIWGLSRSKTEELSELINNYPDRFIWKSCDLSNPGRLKEDLFKDFINFDVKLDGFVNNAAVAYDDIITNVNLERLTKMVQINVFAPIILTKNVIRNMLLHQTKGSIVHISSISAHTGYKGLAMYASTKGALEAFSKNTAREWGERGIRSNCVVAGFMDTEMSASLDSENKDRIYRRTALKKPVSIQSVADTVEFLLSEKSCDITGQNIFVDSGTI